MTNNVEVEFIGEISKKQYSDLKIKFQKLGKYKKTKKRISFMYFKHKIPKNYSAIEDDGLDLRLRITNGEPELIVKQGEFTGAHSRKEVSIYFKPSEVQNYINFLNVLGWKVGVIYAVETLVYEYNGIEFSLVEIKDYGHNFEAEILTDDANINEAKQKIFQELTNLGLKPFDEFGLNKQCNAINNKKDLQFDFSKQSFSEIKEKFKEFF